MFCIFFYLYIFMFIFMFMFMFMFMFILMFTVVCFSRFSSSAFDYVLEIVKRAPELLIFLRLLCNDIQKSYSTFSTFHSTICCVRAVTFAIKLNSQVPKKRRKRNFVTIRVYKVKFAFFFNIKISRNL